MISLEKDIDQDKHSLPSLSSTSSSSQSTLVYCPLLLEKIDSICSEYPNMEIPIIPNEQLLITKKRNSILERLSRI